MMTEPLVHRSGVPCRADGYCVLPDGHGGQHAMNRAPRCPATREAVWEREESSGDFGCPICGRDAEDHRAEQHPCSHCGGDGESGYAPGPVDFDGPYPCPRCKGSGVEPKESEGRC